MGSQDRPRPSPAGHQPFGCHGGFCLQPWGLEPPPEWGMVLEPRRTGEWRQADQQGARAGPLLETLSQTHRQPQSGTGPSGAEHGAVSPAWVVTADPEAHPGWAVIPGSQEQGQGPGAWAGWVPYSGVWSASASVSGPNRGAPEGSVSRGEAATSRHPTEPGKDAAGKRGAKRWGWGAGGGTGAAAKARPCWGVGPGRAAPCMHWAR